MIVIKLINKIYWKKKGVSGLGAPHESRELFALPEPLSVVCIVHV